MKRLFTTLRKHEVVSGFVVSVGIHIGRYVTGDYIAQSQEDHKYDVTRGFTFGSFGAYAGAMYYFVYGATYSKIMSKGVSPIVVAIADSCITVHFVYFPIYYLMKEYMQSETPSWQAALKAANENRWDDTKALLTIYTPIHLMNFYAIPTAWRGTFSGAAGVVWVTALSYLRGAAEERPDRVSSSSEDEAQQHSLPGKA